MDYKLKIQTMNNLLDKLEDYYITLIEVRRELSEQEYRLIYADKS